MYIIITGAMLQRIKSGDKMLNVEVWDKMGIDTKSLFIVDFDNFKDAVKFANKIGNYHPVTIWKNNCRVMDIG